MRPPVDSGVVILTGASSGIGEAMAKILAKKAQVLVLVARRQERLEALAASLSSDRAEIMVLPCDLTDEAATKTMVAAVEAAHGQVDVLINNAGMGDVGLFSESSWEKNRRMIDVNITALLFLTHRVLPGMVKRGRGGILNVSSGFGLTWMPIFSAYVASKHFVSSFSESLRTELSGTGVVVTQLCPGPVATEFEQIAGNPTGGDVPDFIQLSADQCARAAISGFMRGRAVIVPGFLAFIGISLGRMTPSWVLRILYAPAGRMLRRKQVSSGE